jgi:hypothetical protein
MRLDRAKLRELVCAEFGSNLERLTPAGAQDFLDRLYRDLHIAAHPPGSTIEIDETAGSYEQIMAEFFTSTLEMEAEDAAVMLWLYAFQQHFALMQEEYTERFLHMFGKPDSDSEESDEQKQ